MTYNKHHFYKSLKIRYHDSSASQYFILVFSRCRIPTAPLQLLCASYLFIISCAISWRTCGHINHAVLLNLLPRVLRLFGSVARQESPGEEPLAKEPEDSGYEIGFCREAKLGKEMIKRFLLNEHVDSSFNFIHLKNVRRAMTYPIFLFYFRRIINIITICFQAP